jgi:hypothetical protein
MLKIPLVDNKNNKSAPKRSLIVPKKMGLEVKASKWPIEEIECKLKISLFGHVLKPLLRNKMQIMISHFFN